MKNSLQFCSLLICLFVVAGCSGSAKKQLPTVRVEGKLFVDDKPFGPAMVSLASSVKEIPSASGVAKPDGTFTLSTYKANDGVVEGEFTVQLLMDPMAATLVPAVSPETVSIKKSSSGLLKLELKLKSTGKDPANLGGPPGSP